MTALTTVAKVPYPVGTDPLGQADLHMKAVADWIEAQHVNRCKVYPGATVNTIGGAGAGVNVSFGSESYDPGNLHSTVTNPQRVTVSKAGRYQVSAQVYWPPNATAWRYLTLSKNGASIFAQTMQMAVTTVGVSTLMQVSGSVLLAAADYVVLAVAQGSGVNLNLNGGEGETFLEVQWVGEV